MGPLTPCPELRRADLWRQFLSDPVIWASILNEVETIKNNESESEQEDDESHNLSDLSRISLTTEGSTSFLSTTPVGSSGALLPPMSPRTPRTPDASHSDIDEKSFFLEKNIDQVPERNISRSPELGEEECVIGIQVPVIKFNASYCIDTEDPPTPHKAKTNSSANSSSHSANIPPFYKSPTASFLPPSLIASIKSIFTSISGGTITRQTSEPLCIVLGFSTFLSTVLFNCVYGSRVERGGCDQFLAFWQKHINLLSEDTNARLYHLLEGCRGGLLHGKHLVPLVATVMDVHPQLCFFRESVYVEMHIAYINEVTASLLFAGRGWRRGSLNRRQFSTLRLHLLLDQLANVDTNINDIPHFSYDQFYVCYVKFVELNHDGQNYLDHIKLLDFDGGGLLTKLLVDRVFSRCVTGDNMEFIDWVYFLLAFVDTSNPASQDYWFLALDTDDDGVLSLEELYPFYVESVGLLVQCGIMMQPVKWEDLVAQIVDTTSTIVNDNKKVSWSRMSQSTNVKFPHILNAFINIFKFLSDDECDVGPRSSVTSLQSYISKSLLEIDR